MAESEGFIARTFGGVVSNALYDGLRGLCGGGVVAFGTVIWQYMKHRPIDWWGIFLLGLFVFIVLGLLLRMHGAVSRATNRLTSSPDTAAPAPLQDRGTMELEEAQKTHKEEMRRLEASNVSDLWRANEARRQCEAERREALGKLAIFTPLQLEAFQLVNELKESLKSLPPCPGEAISPDEPAERMGELLIEKLGQISAWASQVGHAYSARFSARVADFSHRLGAKGVDVSELEQYSKAGDTVNIIKALQDLTWKIGDA